MNDQLAIHQRGGYNQATNLVNIHFLHVGILQDLFDGLYRLLEEIHVEFFKFGPGERLGEVIAILEALYFDTRALLARKCPLGLLNLTLEFSESAEILGNVGTSFLLVGLNVVIDDTVVEIFSTKMGVTSGSQDFKETIADRK